MASESEAKGHQIVDNADETYIEGSSPNTSQPASLKDPDKAYSFLRKIGATHGPSAEVNMKALRRKVDWQIVPLMFLCYTMQFLDKVSLNVRSISVLTISDCTICLTFVLATVRGSHGTEQGAQVERQRFHECGYCFLHCLSYS